MKIEAEIEIEIDSNKKEKYIYNHKFVRSLRSRLFEFVKQAQTLTVIVFRTEFRLARIFISAIWSVEKSLWQYSIYERNGIISVPHIYENLNME